MKTMKRRLCAILCATLLAGLLVPTASAANFTDTSGHWAADYIEACAGRGIVDGVGGGKFDPEGQVTNAQFIKMLCAAFYSTEEQTFENENRAAINTYFGGSIQWYSGKSYYFEKMGLLTNVDYVIQSSASADQPMNRTNMAQVTANVLKQKGIIANESDKALAQAKLIYVSDYYNIPENNRDAVKTCYALGIITGTDAGKFDGENTMTRAQACTVITRLLDAIGKGPTPEPEKPTTVEVKSTVTSSNGTYYEIVDNGYPTGTLNNGKPITSENITEMMLEAQKIWPDGMVWAEREVSNNNWYQFASRTVTKGLQTAPCNASTNYGCGAFAAMLSDYVFGKSSNPMYRVTDVSKLRPGDIIYWLHTEVSPIGHVVIVIDTVKTGPYEGQLFIADGNSGDMVQWHKWPEILQNLNKPGAHWYSCSLENINEMGDFVAFSRWPQ